MKTSLCWLAVILGVALGVQRSPAQAPAEPKAIVARAIKAAGGEEKLAKSRGETFKMRGQFHGLGEAIPFSGQWAVELPDRMRMQMDMEANGAKFTFVRLRTGGKLWQSLNGMTSEVTGEEELAEERESRHASLVSSLLPLKEAAFTLTLAPERKINERPAVAVKVSHKDRRDVHLFFDKETGLLVGTEHIVKDLMAGGTELKQETLYSDHREVGGIKKPTKVLIRRDGRTWIEGEQSDFKFAEKLDDTAFAMP